MIKTRYLAAIAAALYAGGLGTGLLAKPARVVTHNEETTKERIVYQDRIVEHATADVKTTEVTRWRTHIITQPNGAREETTETDTGKDASSATTTAVDRTVAVEHVTEKIVIRDKLVEGAHPRWLVGAGAGMDLHGGVHYGGLVSWRALGPLNIAATVDVPARAALLYLGVSF